MSTFVSSYPSTSSSSSAGPSSLAGPSHPPMLTTVSPIPDRPASPRLPSTPTPQIGPPTTTFPNGHSRLAPASPDHAPDPDDDLELPGTPLYTIDPGEIAETAEEALGDRAKSKSSFTFAVAQSRTVYENDLVVQRHGLEVGYGEGAEVYHVLSHEGETNRVADESLVALQEVGMRRYAYNQNESSPPIDYKPSPFHTYLCGPISPTPIDDIPCGRSIPWHKSPCVFLDVAELINERCALMWPGENDLLVAMHPPDLPVSVQPKIILEPNTYTSLLYLGSDGILRFRSTSPRARLGQIRLQHGDIVGVHVGPKSLELSPRLDGFGFVCIARQVFLQLPATQPLSSLPSYSTPTLPHFPPLPPLPHLPPSNSSIPAPKTRKRNAPLPPAKLDGWYLGPFPICPSDPLRVLRPLRPGPVADFEALSTVRPKMTVQKGKKGKAKRVSMSVEVEEQETKRWTGMEFINEDQLVFPPSSNASNIVKPPLKDHSRDDEVTKVDFGSAPASTVDLGEGGTTNVGLLSRGQSSETIQRPGKGNRGSKSGKRKASKGDVGDAESSKGFNGSENTSVSGVGTEGKGRGKKRKVEEDIPTSSISGKTNGGNGRLSKRNSRGSGVTKVWDEEVVAV
ncbi:hypothetical protein TREMEDRAFT_61987 [Tremella mesenterica DSM 1558]|uniref:uncharacterized protein n=1 Tax=Tremella mesenterica (strain ATCC 24925 / CBS 8224 / DSM 1558 / NBRC 9311 / NRRL Y-6157 / RJB 2259-6 / UBC 559-6) TaxID=578456 RepID=UPI0003F4A48C|nr:uncharacterized protein TREMEDRAFT_61987 [Tremella mesenterica DSM 1558]EIW70228.1 hypothetical protein TREMEDRAFT_61987 [Tremella mesenterica DSM 1558]